VVYIGGVGVLLKIVSQWKSDRRAWESGVQGKIAVPKITFFYNNKFAHLKK
jgi:hypothetical protein